MSDEKELTQRIEEVVDQGATTVEEIHRSIAEMPLDVLERLGLLEQTTSEVRRIQDASLGAIYGLIRDVNHKLAGLAGDLLEQRPSGSAGATQA
jgi:signal transduction histidine kinase